MDHRIFFIRLVATCLAIIAGVLLCPDPLWLLVPVAFFQGNCPCCGTTPCANCSADTPNSFQLDVSGMTNDTCTACSSLDGTWILDNHNEDNNCVENPTGCVWWTGETVNIGCTASSPIGFFLNITLELFVGYVTNLVFTCCTNVNCSGGLGQVDPNGWRHNHGGSKPNCTAISALSLTWVKDSSSSNPQCECCSGSAATVEVTAL